MLSKINIKTALLLITSASLLFGCAAKIVRSNVNTPSTLVDATSRIDVVFVGSNAQKDAIQALGLQVSEQFPQVFFANGFASEAKSLPLAEIPNSPAEYQKLFSKAPETAFILHVRPISSETSCYGGCVSKFRVQSTLVRSHTGVSVWSGTIDLPYPTTRWSGYSGVAEDFANIVVKRLRADGVINQKQ